MESKRVYKFIISILTPILKKSLNNVYQVHDLLLQQVSEDKIPIRRKYLNKIEIIPILPNTIEDHSNLIIIQQTLRIPFQLDIVLSVKPDTYESYILQPKSLPPTIEQLSHASLTKLLEEKSEEFNIKFDNLYKLRQKKFDLDEIKIAQFALSNLLGSISYFYGDTLRYYKPNESSENMIVRTKPGELLATAPGRSFFPRGFFWDEGFEQLVALHWNTSITIEILESWMNRQDKSGYIEREQILGDESRSKVPSKFQVQSEDVANPPTFFITISHLIKYLTQQAEIKTDSSNNIKIPKNIKLKLKEIAEHLELYLNYLVTTQESPVTPGAYQWSSRTKDHVLPSGFDDYPRGILPTDNDLHVDLQSWVCYGYKVLSEISDILELKDHEYKNKYIAYSNTLKEYFFNQKTGLYSDFGMTILKENYEYQVGFLNHDGYVTILPLILGLIDKNSDDVKNIFDLIRDPSKLWSSHGIRSLSSNDTYYGRGENYWRGSIWININYLTLQSLYEIYMKDDCIYKKQATSIYNELRSNIILTVTKEYKRTGYIWEHYDDKSGYGFGVHPFTGWSSLILNIMAEIY